MGVRPPSLKNFKIDPFHDLESVTRTWGQLKGHRWISSLNCQGSLSKVKYVCFVLPFVYLPLVKKSQEGLSRDVRVFQPIMGGTLYFCGANTYAR